MKKILFVDEKSYRFDHYYEADEWWADKSVICKRYSYERKINKYFIFIYLLVFRPSAVVCVQLSTKNFILMRLANLVRVKTIFWQHGIFQYPVPKNRWVRNLNIGLDALYALSDYDATEISKSFCRVARKKVIAHYDLPKFPQLSVTKVVASKVKVAYVGQVMMPEQVEASGASLMEKYLGDVDVFQEFLQLVNAKGINLEVLVKKHPGDRSNYIDDLVERYKFVREVSTEQLLAADYALSYYSTLLLAFKALGKNIIQLPMSNGQYRFEFDRYLGVGRVFRVKSGLELIQMLATEETVCTPLEGAELEFKTISQLIYEEVCIDGTR